MATMTRLAPTAKRRDERALQHPVRVPAQDHAVLERPRLALGRVHDDRRRGGLGRVGGHGPATCARSGSPHRRARAAPTPGSRRSPRPARSAPPRAAPARRRRRRPPSAWRTDSAAAPAIRWPFSNASSWSPVPCPASPVCARCSLGVSSLADRPGTPLYPSAVRWRPKWPRSAPARAVLVLMAGVAAAAGAFALPASASSRAQSLGIEQINGYDSNVTIREQRVARSCARRSATTSASCPTTGSSATSPTASTTQEGEHRPRDADHGRVGPGVRRARPPTTRRATRSRAAPATCA